MADGILPIVPGLMSVAMLGPAINASGVMNQKRKSAPYIKQNRTFVKSAMQTMIGIPLVGAAVGMVSRV